MTVNDCTQTFIEKLRKIGADWKTETAEALLKDVKAACPVDTGSLRDSWKTAANGNSISVGSGEMNAVYTEFGTGLYALRGGGRQTKWVYRDSRGDFHTTSGKKPVRMLSHCYEQGKAGWQRNLENALRNLK